MTAPDRDADLLLNAYVDGELDAMAALEVERRLAADTALAERHAQLTALRRRLRSALPAEPAPPRLHEALARLGPGQMVPPAQVVSPSPRRPAMPRPMSNVRSALARQGGWRAAAAVLFGVALGSSATLLLRPVAEPPVMAEAVADHLRASLAPQPFDVASSDRHTVKPWFAGRLPFTPRVFDLAEAGFPLAGGRVDVLDGAPAATLVFRHGQHVISLIAQPVVTERGQRPAAGGARFGFELRSWRDGGMAYWAVSDVTADELDRFVAAARAKLMEGS